MTLLAPQLEELTKKVEDAASATNNLGRFTTYHIGCYTVVQEAVNYAADISLESRLEEELTRRERSMHGQPSAYTHLLNAAIALVEATKCARDHDCRVGVESAGSVSAIKQRFTEYANTINQEIDAMLAYPLCATASSG